MKVTVLYGGPSSEREVSLVSGKAVIDGLKSAGHEVFASDVSPTDLKGLDHPVDVVFPVLHGAFGESGELQEILEQHGLPFVGSGSAASRLGMDKVLTKKGVGKSGIADAGVSGDLAGEKIDQILGSCVVKAIGGGSSIDVFVCKAPANCMAAAAISAIKQVLARHETALVEQFIDGPELTVGVLEEKPLAPIRIVANAEFFDYQAKYKSADTKHLFDTGLPREVVEKCRELAGKANAVVGAVDLARIDVMLDSAHNPYLLEINTLPGFTPTSLLPEAAAHSGVRFTALVDRLVRRAQQRGPRKS